MKRINKLISFSLISIIVCLFILFMPSWATNDTKQENTISLQLSINTGSGKLIITNEDNSSITYKFSDGKVYSENNTILKSVNLLKNKKVHIDLIADEYYSIENVKMNQETIFKKTDEKVRNSYFSTTTTEDIQISANLTKNNDMIPMKDEQSGKIYFESLLCEENCLEEHIRNNKEISSPECQLVGNSTLRQNLNEYFKEQEIEETQEISLLGLNYSPTVGSTLTGRCSIQFLGQNIHESGYFNVSFTSGDLNGEIGYTFACVDHGKANPGTNSQNSPASYTATCTAVTNTSATYNVVCVPDVVASNYQRISGTITVSAVAPTGTLSFSKSSANTAITNGNSNYTLANAIYGIWRDANITDGTNLGFTVDSNGYSSPVALKPGTYYIKEQVPPKGYVLDTKVYPVVITAGKTTSLKVSEVPKTASINLNKTSSNTELTTENNGYTLKGAVYTVYTDENCTKSFKTMTTDENGKATLSGLPLNKYWVKETTASHGYKLDTKVYELDLRTSTSNTITETVNSVEEPFIYNKSISILLKKVDADTNEGHPQGAASLKDAQYTVKFYTGLYTENPESSVTPFKEWVFKTDANGEIHFSDKYKVSGDELSINGNFPLGTFTIQETKAPIGYLLNNDIIVVSLNTDSANKEIETYHIPTTSDTVKKGDFLFQKKAYDEDNKTSVPLKGATFTVTSKTTGKIVLTLVSNDNGIVTTKIDDKKNETLPYDTYIITETKAPDGHLPVDPFEIEITENGITNDSIKIIEDKIIMSPLTVLKVDKTTGETIKVANTKFRILDSNKNPISMKESSDSSEKVDIFKTDKNGQINLTERLKYGTYYLEEIDAPNGYLKGNLLEFKITTYATIGNPLVIKYSDENAMGRIIIDKTDDETGEVLADATFAITAAEDIITNDGTLRAKKGTVVDTVVTDRSGSAISRQLFLGKYTVQEVSQPNGYVRDNTVYKVELKYKDQETPLVEQRLELNNRQSILGIEKYDEISTDKLANVSFKIWNKADGEESAKVYTTNENGQIEIKKIKVGTYCIKEISSVPGYAVSDQIFEITVADDGTIDGESNKMLYVSNTHIQMIGTSAIDKESGTHFSLGMNSIIVDTVKMTGLQVGKEYTLHAMPMDIDTGEPIFNNDEPIIIEKTFIAESSNQNVAVEIPINLKSLVCKTINIFEELYDENVLVAEHKDLTDQEQNIEVKEVQIGTTATANDTNTNISKFKESTTITDTVKYENIIPNLEYIMSGILVDKTTGEPILIDDKMVESSTQFTPTDETGTVDVVFTFNSESLKGKDIVVYESLMRNDEEITNHKDKDDEGQTIVFPDTSIKTSVINKDTNTKFAQIGDELTFVDTVSYIGLIPNKEWVVKGKLMDKKTNKPLLIDGKEVVSEAKFTPTESDGTVDVTFKVNTSSLVGKDIVVFEKLYYHDVEFANHEDINDKDQTINVPHIEIKTKVNQSSIDPISNGKFTDTVSYKGLIPGYEYTVKGTVMNKETGKALLINNKKITAEAKFKPDKSDGTVDVVFTIDTSSLVGKNLVVFEKIYYANVELAKHEDINDKDQTIAIKGPETKKTQTGDNHLATMILLLSILGSGIGYTLWYFKKNKQ